MNRDDIVHRINFSSAHSVCIHRDIISNELSEIVKSIYIENSDNEKYTIAIEFDPTEMVGQGDGWIWNSTPTNLDNIVKILENHTNKKISEWDFVILDNISEASFNETDNSKALIQDEIFEKKYDSGHLLLPDLLGYAEWKKMPYTYRKKYGLI